MIMIKCRHVSLGSIDAYFYVFCQAFFVTVGVHFESDGTHNFGRFAVL